MIGTDNRLIPGTEVKHIKSGKITTVLTGSYEEANIGWMLKTSLHPGGFPATEYEAVTTKAVTVQPVTFEISIIEKEEPVKLTVALVTDKLKPLYGLKIDNYLDEKGYEECKKGKNKAVKARTAIKKKEDEVLAQIKARHATEISRVTDYTAELYKVCLDAQNDLQAKMDKADKERTAEANRLAEEKKARTEARDNKMFSLGMKYNGKGFMEYGKYIDQEVLHAMAEDKYNDLVVEIEGLQMEQGVTGKVVEAEPVQPQPTSFSSIRFNGKGMSELTVEEKDLQLFDNQVYSCSAGGYIWVLTKGQVITIEKQVIANERIMDSGIYSQVIAK